MLAQEINRLMRQADHVALLPIVFDIQMTESINNENFGGRLIVTCNTCHQGQPQPPPVPAIAASCLAEVQQFEDYKEVEGVKLPLTITIRLSKLDGDLIRKFTEIKHNVALDNAMFNRPVAR